MCSLPYGQCTEPPAGWGDLFSRFHSDSHRLQVLRLQQLLQRREVCLTLLQIIGDIFELDAYFLIVMNRGISGVLDATYSIILERPQRGETHTKPLGVLECVVCVTDTILSYDFYGIWMVRYMSMLPSNTKNTKNTQNTHRTHTIE